jgi:hypothetical protein
MIDALLGKLRTYSTLGLVLLLVAVAGYAMLTDRALDDTRRERDEAVRQRQAAERAIIVLSDLAAHTAETKTLAGEVRDEISRVSEGNDRPISETLRAGLRGADRIGRLK